MDLLARLFTFQDGNFVLEPDWSGPAHYTGSWYISSDYHIVPQTRIIINIVVVLALATFCRLIIPSTDLAWWTVKCHPLGADTIIQQKPTSTTYLTKTALEIALLAKEKWRVQFCFYFTCLNASFNSFYGCFSLKLNAFFMALRPSW